MSGTPERWQQIERLFHEALDCDPAARDAFLDAACSSDGELRREVESLLASDAAQGGQMESVAARAIVDWAAAESAGALIGRVLGRFRIEAPLGIGGMGEVYLAEDMTLPRRVALKLLPARFTSDPERVRRFEQEARAASALNHPNIVTIYEIGHTDSLHYIAAELVDGETLRQTIARGQLPAEDLIEIAIQIASALAAAHAVGIVHRDVKPENIMVRRDGYIKVLDFGLAKLAEAATTCALSSGTRPGTVMGTVHYMSPEQALGKDVDQRTDIFSFGVVLYELATGRLPFKGDSDAAVYDAILHHTPAPAREQNPELPGEIDRILRRALEKDVDIRYQTASDLRSELKRLERDSSGILVAASTAPGPVAEILPRRQGRRGWIAAAVLAVVGAAVWYAVARRPLMPASEAPFTATFEQVTSYPGPELFPTLSPDGRSLAYAAREAGNWDIFLQRIGGSNAVNLTQDSSTDDTQPAFSPDGDRIAFRSDREDGGIFVMGATGESVKRLTQDGYNPTWSHDGSAVFYADESVASPISRTVYPSRLWSVNVETGERRLISADDVVQPSCSPAGHRIAFWTSRGGGDRHIWTMATDGRDRRLVTNDSSINWNPVWSPDGGYLYFASDRGGSMNLWRIRMEEASGDVLGAPQPVTTPSTYTQHLSFSRDGRSLAYVQALGGATGGANLHKIAWNSLTGVTFGDVVPITSGSRRATGPTVSPDGKHVAFSSTGSFQEDLFVVGSDGSGRRQLTDDKANDRVPKWSPDGRWIGFYSDRTGKYEVWVIHPDGSGLEQVTSTTTPTLYPIWSPDGSSLAITSLGSTASILDANKPWLEQKPDPLPPMDPAGSQFHAWSWSPDGRALAGSVADAGGVLSGVAVYDFDQKRYTILTTRGSSPHWMSDSRRLIFRNQGGLLMIDRYTKQVTPVLSLPPHIIEAVTLTPTNLFFNLVTQDADVWVATLADDEAR